MATVIQQNLLTTKSAAEYQTYIDARETANDDATYVVRVVASDIAGNTATTTKTFILDTTANPSNLPQRLQLNTIATDDIINAAEKTAGVTISGTATGANGETISVSWGGIDKTATIANNGTWTVTYNTADIPADASSSAISANVSDTAANPATEVSKTVVIDTTAPTITINTVATDDIINAAEKTAGVIVSGTATGC